MRLLTLVKPRGRSTVKIDPLASVGRPEIAVVRATRFTDPAAVDAWDKWFRWRDADCLHDRTIDATWWRVANAMVPDQTANAAQWAHRYADAFSRWQLLPDERLLCVAGTGAGMAWLESPCAVLNVAMFVMAPHSRNARLDDESVRRIAGLAVRMLDDATLAIHGPQCQATALRIGVIGFADALDRLGIDYDDAQAAGQASAIGAALASGALDGSLELTRERGPLGPAPERLLSKWRARCIPDERVDEMTWRGIRHSQLTAIEAQPRLALLANNASDALDPRAIFEPDPSIELPAEPSGARAANSSATAQAAIRDAIRRWIDAPIDGQSTVLEGPVGKAGESIARTD